MAMCHPEDEGGDPPCWAHLFPEPAEAEPTDSPASTVSVANLVALARGGNAEGAVWTNQSEDLNINLLVFATGRGVAEHVNNEVDVLLVGVAGLGTVEVDGQEQGLAPGAALVIPKGTRRATRATGDRFAYLSCHRRRGGIWPTR